MCPNAGEGGGGVAGSQPMSTTVYIYLVKVVEHKDIALQEEYRFRVHFFNLDVRDVTSDDSDQYYSLCSLIRLHLKMKMCQFLFYVVQS
jgi:hypothetical protein